MEENKLNEMYYYYTHFEKIMSWKRTSYCIKALSKEDADKVMKDLFKEGELDSSLENPTDALLIPWWCDDGAGDYYDSDEWSISYKQNNNAPTEELYDEANDLLEDNTPIEVRREKTIDFILS